ncbi:MAG: MmgE/PrpD family protein [Thermoplasmatales archaeon]
MKLAQRKELKLNLANETEIYLADYITNEVTEDETTRERAKEILFDTIGVMSAGSKTTEAKIVAKIAKSEMPGDVPLLGGGSASLWGATLANSASSYCLDLDAVYEPSTLHIAAILTPLILTLATKYKLTLREVIDAFHVGYNVAASFGDSLTSKEMYSRYFHPTAIAGAFGASAASSRIICKKKECALNSLRLVSLMASGLTTVFNEQLHQSAPMQVANSAFSGIRATVLANEGINGPPLFYKKSVFYPFSGKEGVAPEFELVRKLTDDRAELKTSFKRHSACLFLQSGVDAALELRDEIGTPTEGDKIDLIVDPAIVDLIDNAGDVTHNAQLVISMAFNYGKVNYEDFAKALDDANILRTKKNISILRDQSLLGHYPTSLPSIIRITSVDGKVHEARVEYHKGHSKNPMSLDDLRTKFENLVNIKDRDAQLKLDSIFFGDEDADFSETLSLIKRASK